MLCQPSRDDLLVDVQHDLTSWIRGRRRRRHPHRRWSSHRHSSSVLVLVLLVLLVRRVAVGRSSSGVGESLLLVELLLVELSGRVDSGGRGVGEEEFDVGSLDDLGEDSRVDVPDLDEVVVKGHDPRVVESCRRREVEVSEEEGRVRRDDEEAKRTEAGRRTLPSDPPTNVVSVLGTTSPPSVLVDVEGEV